MNLNERQLKIKSRISEDDFISYVEDILRWETLCDSPVAEGIAKKIVSDQSIDNLSNNQLETFIIYGIDTDQNYSSSCIRCATEIPWCEMLHGIDEGGYCNYCWHMKEKED